MSPWEFLFDGPGLVIIVPSALFIAGCLLCAMGQALINRFWRQ